MWWKAKNFFCAWFSSCLYFLWNFSFYYYWTKRGYRVHWLSAGLVGRFVKLHHRKVLKVMFWFILKNPFCASSAGYFQAMWWQVQGRTQSCKEALSQHGQSVRDQMGSCDPLLTTINLPCSEHWHQAADTKTGLHGSETSVWSPRWSQDVELGGAWNQPLDLQTGGKTVTPHVQFWEVKWTPERFLTQCLDSSVHDGERAVPGCYS